MARKNNVGNLLLTLGLIATTAFIGYASEGFTNWDFSTWFEDEYESFDSENLSTTLQSKNGIELKVRASNSTTALYGSQVITYEASKSYNDEVLFKIAYADETELPEGILTIIHDKSGQTIQIDCNDVFRKQIVLTIYAASNEDVNAKINVDFKEKITISPSLEIVEGEPLSIDANIISTGGTIEVDKTISNEVFTFNADFVNTATYFMKYDAYNQLTNDEIVADEMIYYFSVDSYDYRNYNDEEGTSYTSNNDYFADIVEASSVGLSNASSWLENNFSYQTFAQSINLNLTGLIYDLVSDKGQDVEVIGLKKDGTYTMNICDLSAEHFDSLFDGTKPIFDYSCTINNNDYTASFGLKIDEVNITSITINSNNVIF